VIQLRHRQPSLWHSGLAKDIEDLWEPWMKEVDQLLEDAALVESVYDAQGKRHRKSRTHGRTQTPAEVALRLLILKHVRSWSYDTLEREVRANLVYRAFTRIGDEKVPDAKTLARLGQVIGPEVIGELHQIDGASARARGGARTEDEGRHHGGGDEYSLSNRQQSIRGWSGCAHANHEGSREGCGWTEEADS
jgi:transposase, IS5 family